MYFLDLEDLKIIKSYKFENVGVAGNIDIMNSNLLELKNHFDTQTDILFASVNNAIETCFYYYIGEQNNMLCATDEETEAFLGAVNIILTSFFNHIILDEGRKREHRLGVPEKISQIKMSYSLLKKAINQKTKINKFNIIIQYKDLTYSLCDGDKIEEKEFVHDVTELEA